jgi:hypothetical protein
MRSEVIPSHKGSRTEMGIILREKKHPWHFVREVLPFESPEDNLAGRAWKSNQRKDLVCWAAVEKLWKRMGVGSFEVAGAQHAAPLQAIGAAGRRAGLDG